MFLPADHFGHDALAIQRRGNTSLHLVDHGFAIASSGGYGAGNTVRAQRIQRTKSKFLQFALDHLDAEPVGDRRIKISAFLLRYVCAGRRT